MVGDRTLAGLCACICWSSVGLAAAQTASTGADNAAIIGRALQPSPLLEDLRRLTDEVGGRVSGTPAMSRAIDWALNTFREAGIASRTENYIMPLTWSEAATKLEMLNGPEFPISLAAEGWSAPTPAAGIEAPLVHVGDGTQARFTQLNGRIRGAILLVDAPVIQTWEDLNNEYDRALPIKQRAVEAGALAILWTGARAHRLLYRHTDTVEGEISPLPMATVAREDGLRLARLADAAPAPLRVRLTMPNRIGGPAPERNVIGEIRGRERPQEVVILGAHLDSWDLGTGALDNGCNAALVIAAARAIRESGVRPRRTIRFVLFSGEEEGYQGSRAYVLQHRSELDRTLAMVVVDSGNGRIKGYTLSGRSDTLAPLRSILRPLGTFDAAELSLDGELGTDNIDFMLEGVPTLVADQEPATYMENYHAASDTFDKVSPPQLALNAAIAALTVYAIAEADDPIGPRLTRLEIEKQLQGTGLDKEMKTAGMWIYWSSGKRGRSP